MSLFALAAACLPAGGGSGTDTSPSSACGNGVVEPGESCDDGNDIDDDACRKDCAWNLCGDGGELVASDEGVEDFFGLAVAAGEQLLVISAPHDDDNGERSGSVYLCERATSGGTWVQTAKLRAFDGAPNDYFGSAVATNGLEIIVGAGGDDDNGGESGSFYVFERIADKWVSTGKITASDESAGASFGTAAAIDGSTVVIGARRDDNVDGDWNGSAYVFEKIDGQWTERAKLMASDQDLGDFFGTSVAIHGTTIVVGAYGDDKEVQEYDYELLSGRGAAYVFERVGGEWIQTQKLLADDGLGGDSFGFSVATSGDHIVVGANQMAAGDGQGSAYVFAKDQGQWVQSARIFAAGGAPGDHFGDAVGIDGETIVVGAHGAAGSGQESGAAFVFTLDGDKWVQTQVLAAADGDTGDSFGSSLAVAAGRIVAGAHRHTHNRFSESGAAYVFAY